MCGRPWLNVCLGSERAGGAARSEVTGPGSILVAGRPSALRLRESWLFDDLVGRDEVGRGGSCREVIGSSRPGEGGQSYSVGFAHVVPSKMSAGRLGGNLRWGVPLCLLALLPKPLSLPVSLGISVRPRRDAGISS